MCFGRAGSCQDWLEVTRAEFRVELRRWRCLGCKIEDIFIEVEILWERLMSSSCLKHTQRLHDGVYRQLFSALSLRPWRCISLPCLTQSFYEDLLLRLDLLNITSFRSVTSFAILSYKDQTYPEETGLSILFLRAPKWQTASSCLHLGHGILPSHYRWCEQGTSRTRW
jgi:hypothetical protein